MHLQVYLDTNVLLGLLASEMVLSDAMRKFLAMCENGSIELYLPEQTEVEFSANREDVVARTLEALTKAKGIGGLPSIVETHPSHDRVCALRRDLSQAIGGVEQSYGEAARAHQLPVDEWLTDLKRVARWIPTSPEILKRAKHRAAVHLPPGKGDSLGDRIIWEALLEAGAFFEDLHLISADNKDYRSPLNPGQIRKTLQDEWAESHMGSVVLYSSLDEFLTSAAQTESFARATEIGRAIWTIGTQSGDEAIDISCTTIERYMAQLSVLQARLIAKNAKLYYDRVFITTDLFDRTIAEFWRLYGKHLDEEEGKLLEPVLIASGATSYPAPKAANRN